MNLFVLIVTELGQQKETSVRLKMKKCTYCGKKATIFLERLNEESIPLCEWHFRENIRMCEEEDEKSN